MVGVGRGYLMVNKILPSAVDREWMLATSEGLSQ